MSYSETKIILHEIDTLKPIFEKKNHFFEKDCKNCHLITGNSP